jgi:hypothetical protein
VGRRLELSRARHVGNGTQTQDIDASKASDAMDQRPVGCRHDTASHGFDGQMGKKECIELRNVQGTRPLYRARETHQEKNAGQAAVQEGVPGLTQRWLYFHQIPSPITVLSLTSWKEEPEPFSIVELHCT